LVEEKPAEMQAFLIKKRNGSASCQGMPLPQTGGLKNYLVNLPAPEKIEV
jgi:hypothetical protein